MHHLLCAWSPPEADGIAGNVSIYKLLITVGWRTVWTRFSDYRFSKRLSCRDIVDPSAQRKNSLMQSACAWCVCAGYIVHVIARVQSCSHALLRLVRRRATAPARSGPRARRAGGATPGLAHAPGHFAKSGQARLRSISEASWSTKVWAVTEPDACARSELGNFLQNQFSSFCGNCVICDFHLKLAQPPPPRFEMRYV